MIFMLKVVWVRLVFLLKQEVQVYRYFILRLSEKNVCFIVFRNILLFILLKFGFSRNFMFLFVFGKVIEYFISIKIMMKRVGIIILDDFLIFFFIFFMMMKWVVSKNNVSYRVGCQGLLEKFWKEEMNFVGVLFVKLLLIVLNIYFNVYLVIIE